MEIVRQLRSRDGEKQVPDVFQTYSLYIFSIDGARVLKKRRSQRLCHNICPESNANNKGDNASLSQLLDYDAVLKK